MRSSAARTALSVVVFGASLFALAAASQGCGFDTSGAASDFDLGDGGEDTFLPFDAGSGDTHFTLDTGAGGDAIGGDTIVTDAAIDTITPPTHTGPESPTCDTTACGTPPAGAKRLALVDRSVACPADFKQTDVVEAKSGDACGCGCTLGPAPTCAAKVDIATYFSDDGSCGMTGTTLRPTARGACVSLGFTGTLHADFSATLPPPVGGACAKTPTSDASKITAPKRICEPMAGACFGDVCGGAFDECFESAGPCPADYPTAHKIGGSLTVTCPACDCGVDVGTCTGSLDFFSGPGCTGTKNTLAANGACVPVGGAKSVQSYDYVPGAPTGAGCTPSFDTDPGTPSIAGARNLCCR